MTEPKRRRRRSPRRVGAPSALVKRVAVQESPAATPLPAHETALRELQAAREIAHAFLTARTPDEVYRLALERVAPVVGAAFGCVYLRETDDVLRLIAAWNWPAEYREFLGEMRVRVGLGPTGRDVALTSERS